MSRLTFDPKVQNQVAPSIELPMSQSLKILVQGALGKSVIKNPKNIGVSAANGIVTLSGAVENRDEKDIAVAVVKSIPGVKAIVQQLYVEVSAERKYANAIEDNIRAALRSNIEIPSSRIKVSCEPNAIVLEGSVKWNYQKTAALEIAARHKDDLNLIDLIIVDSLLNDELTKEKILAAIAADGRVDCTDLSAIANGRNVILVGSVPSSEQKELLQKITEEIPGVGTVRNAVHVK